MVVLLSCAMCVAREKPAQGPSQHDLKLAGKSFERALRLQKDGQLEAAFEELNKAITLAPDNSKYRTAREMLRATIANHYLQHGNLLAQIGDEKGAEAQFKQALTIDPQNSFAQERLRDAPSQNPEHDHILQLLASVEDVKVVPKAGKSNFHVQGDARELYEAIARAFGITITYDSSFANQRLRFDADDLDFYAVMRLAGKITHTFWAPTASQKVIVAPDNQEMRRQYERLAVQTYYVSNVDGAADLQDIANVLRNIFEVRLVSVIPDKNIITVRAPKGEMEAFAAWLDDAVRGRPEVLLDVKAYELDYNNMRQIGLGLQNTFSIFNVYAAIYSALGTSAQSVINQLQQTGAINPSTVPVGSLGGLQNSPLLQPFIFFGKGWGLTGITVSPITGQLSSNVSYTTDLEHVTLRATSGNAATLLIGTRFPISLGSFTNVSITTTGQPQVGSAFPQVQYEDLGLMLKATPRLQSDDNINLELELQIKGLGTQQFNGVPVITNRDYKGSLTVKDGQPSEIAGIVEDQVAKNQAGYPGIGAIPGLSSILNTNSKQHTRTEVLIVVTPHIVRKSFHQLQNAVWDIGR